MNGLREFLARKRRALLWRYQIVSTHPNLEPASLTACATAEHSSGIRRIKIRDFGILSDSPHNFAGCDLGPTSPELLLGALASCLTHSYLIKAAELDVLLHSVNVCVYGKVDLRAGAPGFERLYAYPSDIKYFADITSPADNLTKLNSSVESYCPVLNLLRLGVIVTGSVQHIHPTHEAQSEAICGLGASNAG